MAVSTLKQPGEDLGRPGPSLSTAWLCGSTCVCRPAPCLPPYG